MAEAIHPPHGMMLWNVPWYHTLTTTTAQENSPMPTTPFAPLDALRSSVKGLRTDLQRVRALNSDLSKKTAALNNKSQYAAEYIRTETTKLRAEALDTARAYLHKEGTYTHLSQMQSQKEHWQVRSYVLRGLTVDAPALNKYDTEGNTNTLLKTLIAHQRTTNALLSLSQLPISAIVDVFDTALTTGDAALAAVCYGKLLTASDQGDDGARLAVLRIEHETPFPAVTEANELLTESGKIEEWLGYTVRSLTDGSEDIGVRTQSYVVQQQVMDAAHAQAAAQEQQDIATETTRRAMDGIRPANAV